MATATLDEVRALAAQGYSMIPIVVELMSDEITPITLLRKLQAREPHCFLLESVEDQVYLGRYTFLGHRPLLDVIARGHHVVVKDAAGSVVREDDVEDPRTVVAELLAAYRSPRLPKLPTFTGGFMGYVSYESICYAEPSLHLRAADDEGFRDLDLMLFDHVYAFDNVAKKLILIANVRVDGDVRLDGDVATAYAAARDRLADMRAIVESGPLAPRVPARVTGEFTAAVDEAEFCDRVERAKAHIRAGDAFQIVLSQRLSAPFEGSLLDVYRLLRGSNPSPYMFYLSGDDVEVAGASPETLVKLEDGTLRTFPLAGTRPRGASVEEDQRLEAELLADEKERAEHNMLVDLGRNDLGRVSEFGSVEVERYMDIERYSHVMHIASTVRGRLRDDLGSLDALGAVLPAGTLSGAPKIRACEIIDELEGTRRGLYAGAIGYIDFTGNMDTCIAIRLAYRRGDEVVVRVGAGIVADSVPHNEHVECLNKARAVINAIRDAAEVSS